MYIECLCVHVPCLSFCRINVWKPSSSTTLKRPQNPPHVDCKSRVDFIGPCKRQVYVHSFRLLVGTEERLERQCGVSRSQAVSWAQDDYVCIPSCCALVCSWLSRTSCNGYATVAGNTAADATAQCSVQAVLSKQYLKGCTSQPHAHLAAAPVLQPSRLCACSQDTVAPGCRTPKRCNRQHSMENMSDHVCVC